MSKPTDVPESTGGTMQFRKKPVTIEAVQWTGNNQPEIEAFCPALRYHESEGGNPTIETLEGFHTARVGDYLIKGVKGEFYPCRADIFELTYERVEDAAQEP